MPRREAPPLPIRPSPISDHRARQRRDDAVDHLLVRQRAAADGEMRLGVDRVADLGELAEQGERVLALEQGPVAAAADPLGQRLDLGVEPDRDAAREDQRPRLGVHEGAAAGRDHPAAAPSISRASTRRSPSRKSASP